MTFSCLCEGYHYGDSADPGPVLVALDELWGKSMLMSHMIQNWEEDFHYFSWFESYYVWSQIHNDLNHKTIEPMTCPREGEDPDVEDQMQNVVDG